MKHYTRNARRALTTLLVALAASQANAITATKAYVDAATNATLTAAKQYTDEHGGGGGGNPSVVTNIAKAVVAPATNETLRVAKKYTDDAVIAAGAVTPQIVTNIATSFGYVTKAVTNGILAAAKTYADQYAGQAPNYAAVSNKAMTALQEHQSLAAYETSAHAEATYQPRGNYLTSETDPTVPAWAKAPNPPSVGGITTNDVKGIVAAEGYIKTWTETDPTVKAWAKADAKPSYTAAEVGADAAGTAAGAVATHNAAADAHATLFAGKQATISDLAAIRSGAALGATSVQTETDPTIYAWAKAATKPSYTATEVGADASGTAAGAVAVHEQSASAHADLFAAKQATISDLADIRAGATAGATAVQPAAITDMATKTWVGAQGYLTSVAWGDVSGKPSWIGATKPTYTAAEVGARADDWLPTAAQIGAQPTISDLADIRAGAALGATALQSYTETDPNVPAWAKAENKPSYTATEVGADASGTAAAAVTAHNSAADAHASLFAAKITNPSGGATGQVLTKTADGVTWAAAAGGVTSVTMNGAEKVSGTTAALGTVVTAVSVNGTAQTVTSGAVNVPIAYNYTLGTLASGGTLANGEVRSITTTAAFSATLSLGSSASESADCALYVDASSASAAVTITIGGGYTIVGDSGYASITAGKKALVTFTRISSSTVIAMKKEW